MSSNLHLSHDSSSSSPSKTQPLALTIISFGYKEGSPPLANLLFDVRFLKNPYWVEELRPLTGRDRAVQDYVMQQPLAVEFFESVMHMLDKLLPKLAQENITDFSIAFGCTGGQHRSATLAETLSSEISKKHPHCRIIKQHRELDSNSDKSKAASED